MALAVDVFWSFRSPYSYLATPRLVELQRDYDWLVPFDSNCLARTRWTWIGRWTGRIVSRGHAVITSGNVVEAKASRRLGIARIPASRAFPNRIPIVPPFTKGLVVRSYF